MKRSISYRIYLVGLMPLALLAIALIGFNGIQRLHDAQKELQSSRELAATLLHAPAVEALVIGNSLTFDTLVKGVIASSPAITCISLADLTGRTVSQAGKCNTPMEDGDQAGVETASGALSDFGDSGSSNATVGTLRVSMNHEGLLQKRRQLLLQLIVSFILVLAVLITVLQQLRRRIIRPIQQIDLAMQGVSQRIYTVQLQATSDDEIGRLGRSINSTIDTIADTMRDLERRRHDADRALHDADETAMARDSLVRSLSEELEAPFSHLYTELTTLAQANKDIALRERIKSSIALLDDMQSSFSDLMQVSSLMEGPRRASMQHFSDILRELERSVRVYAATTDKPLQLTMAPTIDDFTGLYVGIDGIRMRKAVMFVIREMFKHCGEQGLFVHVDAIRLADQQLQLSIQLRGFYPPPTNFSATTVGNLPSNNKPALMALRWSQRETKTIDYLLRAATLSASYSVLPSGMVSAQLEAVVLCTDGPPLQAGAIDWLRTPAALHCTIVSDDASLLRFTLHSQLSRHEFKLLPYREAMQRLGLLRQENVLLLDCSHDPADMLELVRDLREQHDGTLPPLVAICTPGTIGEALQERLMQCGFVEVLQKPLQLRRLLDVVQRVALNSTAKQNA